jgi:EAL domain-containing protein (putative c-di-GMP-specific phosphodiesterase class I)
VVVEGLEDRGMQEAACILGATLGQGYSLARPMAQPISFAGSSSSSCPG